jgi:hypothetical protein
VRFDLELRTREAAGAWHRAERALVVDNTTIYAEKREGPGRPTPLTPIERQQVISDSAEATTTSIPGPVTWIALTVIEPVFPLTELVCSLRMTLIPPGSPIETFGIGAEIGIPRTVTLTRSEVPLTDGVVPLHVALDVDFTTSADRPTIGSETLTSVADDVLWSPLPLVVPLSRPTDASPRRLRSKSDADFEPPAAGNAPVSPMLTFATAETLNGLARPLKLVAAFASDTPTVTAATAAATTTTNLDNANVLTTSPS